MRELCDWIYLPNCRVWAGLTEWVFNLVACFDLAHLQVHRSKSPSDPLMHWHRGNNLQEEGAAALAVGLSHIQFLKILVLRWSWESCYWIWHMLIQFLHTVVFRPMHQQGVDYIWLCCINLNLFAQLVWSHQSFMNLMVLSVFLCLNSTSPFAYIFAFYFLSHFTD